MKMILLQAPDSSSVAVVPVWRGTRTALAISWMPARRLLMGLAMAVLAAARTAATSNLIVKSCERCSTSGMAWK